MKRFLLLMGILASTAIFSSAVTYDSENPLPEEVISNSTTRVYLSETGWYGEINLPGEMDAYRTNDHTFSLTLSVDRGSNYLVCEYYIMFRFWNPETSQTECLYIDPSELQMKDGLECSFVVTDVPNGEAGMIPVSFVSQDDRYSFVRQVTFDFSNMTLKVHDLTDAERFSGYIIQTNDDETAIKNNSPHYYFKNNMGQNLELNLGKLRAGSYIFFGGVNDPACVWELLYAYSPSDNILEVDNEIEMTESSLWCHQLDEDPSMDLSSYVFHIEENVSIAKLIFDIETKTLRLEHGENYFTAFNADGVEIEYTVIENAETPQVRLMGIIDGERVVDVPTKVRHGGTTYNITELCDYAFSSEDITSVKLPDSVTKIGQAFRGNKNLTKVQLGKGVQSIPQYAFEESGIKTIDLTSIEEIGDYAFLGSALESLEIPANVTTIGYHAFERTGHLQSIKIGEGIRVLSQGAFYGCGASHYSFPLSLEKIEGGALNIIEGATIDFPDLETFLHLQWDESEYNPSGLNLSVKGNRVSSLIIPDDFTTIPAQVAFLHLTSINTGDGMERVPAVNTAVSSLTLGKNVTRVDGSYGNVKILRSHATKAPTLKNDAFPLLSIELESPGIVILDNESAYKTYIKAKIWEDLLMTHAGMVADVTLETAGDLGYQVDEQCEMPLSKVVDLTVHGTMGADDFNQIMYNMPALLSLNIADVTFDGDFLPSGALAGKTTIQTLVLPESVKKIGAGAFRGCYGISVLSFPSSSLEEIEHNAFAGCSGITSLSLPTTLKKIGSSAFSGCYGISVLSFSSSSLEVIEDHAFAGCSGITSLSIPSTLKKIGSSAFSGCYGILSVLSFPSSSLEEIEDHAFEGCSGIASLSLPATLTKIGNFAFQNCSSISELELPSSLVELGNSAFVGSGITSLKCKGVEIIGTDAFRGTPLESVELSEGLVTIQSGAFANTQLSQRLNFPRSLRTIGSNAFAGITTLPDLLDIHDNITNVGEGAFAGTGIDGVFISNKINEIPASLFAGCKSLDRVQLHDNVIAVGENAFEGCSSLYDLRLSENLQTIGPRSFTKTAIPALYIQEGLYEVCGSAFESCPNLRTVSLPSTTETLGDRAFASCRSLRNLSVSATTPPAVSASTFKGVNTDLCILSIPTSAKREYRNAIIWGRFTTMRNDIAVTIESEGEAEGEITFDTEEEIDDELIEEDPETSYARMAMHRAASENAVADGSTLYIPNEGKVRFYITPADNCKISSVIYNNENVTSQVVNGVYVPTEYKRNAELKVIFGVGYISEIDAIGYSASDSKPIYYNLQGCRVANPSAGMYIVVRGTKVTKELVK